MDDRNKFERRVKEAEIEEAMRRGPIPPIPATVDYPQGMTTMGMCSRPSAKQELSRIIDAHRRRANVLQAFLDRLPTVLDPAADAGLWELLQRDLGRGL